MSEAHPMARQIKVPKASAALANELRAQILEQGLNPGDPFPSEHELIDRHGLSRGTVREALRMLEADGFISIRRGPRGGIRVTHPDASLVSRSLATLLTVDRTPLSSLFEFRKLVEPAVAADAALSATEEQCERLLAFADPENDHAGKSEFHALVVECASNDILRSIMSAVNKVNDWHTAIDDVAVEDVRAAGHAHAKIAEAIASRDPDKAASIMLKHIGAFEKAMGDVGRLDGPILPRDRWTRYLRQTYYGE